MIAAHASPLSIPPLDSPRMGSASAAAVTAPATELGFHPHHHHHPESPTPLGPGPGPQRVGRSAGSRSSSPLRRPDSRGLGHSASATRLGAAGIMPCSGGGASSSGRRSSSLSRCEEGVARSKREGTVGMEIGHASPAAIALVERRRREATESMDVDAADGPEVTVEVGETRAEMDTQQPQPQSQSADKGKEVEVQQGQEKDDSAKAKALSRFGGLLSSKKGSRPTLSLDEARQREWTEMLTRGRSRIVSDASTLPRSTNMGIKHTSIHAHGYVNPASIAAAKERSGYECEQDDGEKKVAARPTPRTQFFKAIPCIFVDHIASSLAFYTRVLGFSLRSKADATRAHLVRATPSSPILGASAGAPRRRPGEGPAMVEGVEIFLRTVPKENTGGNGAGEASDGARPGPQTLWIMVQSVDEYHAEISNPLSQFQPRADEYFPELHLGQAGVSGRPQNKAWGNREMTVTDPDGNKLVFFTPLDR